MRETESRQRLRWAQNDARRVTLGLTRDDLLRLYRQMLLARLTDDRQRDLYARGLAPASPTCRGHEAAQVGLLEPFHPGADYLLPYYRDLAAVLAVGMSPAAALLNLLGRRDDPNSGGRMRPAQWNSRALNIVSASGLVGTQTLHAAGIAFAARLRRAASVALTCFGDGATSEGDFAAALNFAALHRLGVVFACENNGIALSTPLARQLATRSVADRAAGFGLPGVPVDGAEVLAVVVAAREAFARARAGQGPTLLDIAVPAPGDADETRDPLALFRDYLLARGDLTDADDDALRRDLGATLDDAERQALAAPPPDPADALRGVVADPPAEEDP